MTFTFISSVFENDDIWLFLLLDLLKHKSVYCFFVYTLCSYLTVQLPEYNGRSCFKFQSLLLLDKKIDLLEILRLPSGKALK